MGRPLNRRKDCKSNTADLQPWLHTRRRGLDGKKLLFEAAIMNLVTDDVEPGWCGIRPVDRGLLHREQSHLLQPCRRPHQEGPPMPGAPWGQQEDHGPWRGHVQQVGTSPSIGVSEGCGGLKTAEDADRSQVVGEDRSSREPPSFAELLR